MNSLLTWENLIFLAFVVGAAAFFFRADRHRRITSSSVCEGVCAGYFGDVSEILSRNKVTCEMIASSHLGQIPAWCAADILIACDRDITRTAVRMDTPPNVVRAIFEILDVKGLVAEEEFTTNLSTTRL